MLSSNSMLIARFITGKGLVVHRRLCPKEDRSMRKAVMHLPKCSWKKICAILHLKGTAISSSTVSRCLSKEFVLKTYRLARKTYLTPVMKKNLLDFPRHHHHWTLTAISCYKHIRQLLGKHFDKKYTVCKMAFLVTY